MYSYYELHHYDEAIYVCRLSSYVTTWSWLSSANKVLHKINYCHLTYTISTNFNYSVHLIAVIHLLSSWSIYLLTISPTIAVEIGNYNYLCTEWKGLFWIQDYYYYNFKDNKVPGGPSVMIYSYICVIPEIFTCPCQCPGPVASHTTAFLPWCTTAIIGYHW